jgi:hypothetical protein
VFETGVGRIPLLVRMFTIMLAVAALAPAAASAWMPDPVQFSRAVPLRAGAGGSFSGTVHSARRFDLVGAEWRGARAAHVELRVRQPGGRWSRWAEAGAGDDGPDGGARHSAHSAGAPVWAGGANRVQLRTARRLPGLRVRLINTTGSATPGARARTRVTVARRGAFGARRIPKTSARMPAIVPRAAWGASRCKPRDTPSYGNVRVAYVHHTVSLNGYSRASAASMVLGICLFHRNGNGWDDIGYNFLIDRYGTVYEGRAGGVDAPVLGAQAGGFNSESTGVSMIGNFTSSAPPKAAMQSLAKLLAWKLSLHGVPATGRVKVTSAGGGSTGYRAGTKVTVNRISGHRDVDLTACPGAALYRRLPALRRSVAKLEGPISRLTIAPSAGATYGSPTTLTGVLTVPGGASPAGATVELRQLTGSRSERVLATTTAAGDGSWSATLPPLTASALVRAVFAGDAGRPGVVSPPAYLGLLPRIGLTATPAQLAPGGTVTASGEVRPAKARVTVFAYLESAAGGERRVASRTAGASSGSYTAKLKLTSAGSYRIVTRAGADARSGSGKSPSATVRVASPG